MFVRIAEAFEVAGYVEEQVRAMIEAGASFDRAGEFSTCIPWYERGRDVSAQHGFVLLECEVCSALGRVFNNLLGIIGGRGGAEEQWRRGLAGVERVLQDASHAEHTRRDRASRQDPRVLQRVLLRDLVYAARADRVEEAEDMFRRLREEGGNNAECLLWNKVLRGKLHACRSNHREAADAYQSALDFAGTHPSAVADEHGEEALSRAKRGLQHMRQEGNAPPLSTIFGLVVQAEKAGDNAGVLRWESKLEAMLEAQVS